MPGMNRITHLKADTDVDAIATHLENEGCVIIERLAPDELLDQIDTDLGLLLNTISHLLLRREMLFLYTFFFPVHA